MELHGGAAFGSLERNGMTHQHGFAVESAVGLLCDPRVKGPHEVRSRTTNKWLHEKFRRTEPVLSHHPIASLAVLCPHSSLSLTIPSTSLFLQKHCLTFSLPWTELIIQSLGLLSFNY